MPTISPIRYVRVSGVPDCVTHASQILIGPPSPAELFSPSPPPVHPTRLTSPPPQPSLTTTPATAIARDQTLPASSAVAEATEVRRSSYAGVEAHAHAQGVTAGTSAGGGIAPYLEQAKDGLRAVGARAGAVTGWGQRGGLGRNGT